MFGFILAGTLCGVLLGLSSSTKDLMQEGIMLGAGFVGLLLVIIGFLFTSAPHP